MSETVMDEYVVNDNQKYAFAKVVLVASELSDGDFKDDVFDAIMRQVARERADVGIAPLSESDAALVRFLLQNPSGIAEEFVAALKEQQQ